MISYRDFLLNAKKIKIDKNFTLYEVVYSSVALKNNIDNRLPSNVEFKSSVLLIKNILQPIRDYFNKPVDIYSFYRCPSLNKIINGEPTSQHLKGQAVDFNIKGVLLDDIYQFIRKNLDYDQVIIEPSWIHISYVNTNRKENLKFDGNSYHKI